MQAALCRDRGAAGSKIDPCQPSWSSKCRFHVSARRVKCYESPSALFTPEWFYDTRDFSGRRKEERRGVQRGGVTPGH